MKQVLTRWDLLRASREMRRAVGQPDFEERKNHFLRLFGSYIQQVSADEFEVEVGMRGTDFVLDLVRPLPQGKEPGCSWNS